MHGVEGGGKVVCAVAQVVRRVIERTISMVAVNRFFIGWLLVVMVPDTVVFRTGARGKKMKYNKIVWWQKTDGDYEIGLAKEICNDKNLNLIIVNNINDFDNIIDTESFIVLSVLHADEYLEEIEKIIEKHETQIFHLHWRMDEETYTLNEMKLLSHPRVVKPEDYSILLRLAQGERKGN